jgi:hypothetical protein
MPYRTAWALVDEAERALGQPLLVLERGVGRDGHAAGRAAPRRAPRGATLLDAHRDELDVPLVREPATAERPGLSIAASHDLVLAELRDAWSRRFGIAIAFHGSEEALALYLDGPRRPRGLPRSVARGDAASDALHERLDRAATSRCRSSCACRA